MGEHYIVSQMRRERNQKPTFPITDLELNSVDVAWCDDGDTVDERKFTCTICNSTCAKSSCVGHMFRYHQIPKEVSAKWATCKDGRTLANTSDPEYLDANLKLTKAYFVTSKFVFFKQSNKNIFCIIFLYTRVLFRF